MIGFRAPYLAKSPGLYTALKNNGFRYDTSGVGKSDAWPEKIDGIWRFNLAMLRIAGSGKGTLSMDYNFFVAQSGAAADPRRYEMAREQTLQTYLHYFKANYTGNRAPLHIGHHFTAYQGGVYNEALKSFARAVCGLPEVRCVTYAKLADFMDAAEPRNARGLPQGRFPRAPSADAERRGEYASSAQSVRDLTRLPAQHRALAREAPVIAGDVAALAEHAVARHHERDRVLADRGADRARGLRRADLAAMSE